MIPIDIISGFASSGKTTLIQMLLTKVYKNKKVYIIQNESGSIEPDNLKPSNNVFIQTIRNGCLCCSNSGKLERTMKDILERKEYEQVIIELSGTARLSDLLFFVQKQSNSESGVLSHVVTVLNTADFERRMLISERFLQHQIGHTSSVYLNWTELVSEKELEQIQEQILNWNPDCMFLERNLENWTETTHPCPPHTFMSDTSFSRRISDGPFLPMTKLIR